ncbi:hypothetical protein AG1IA_00481 [Rhizoctonia solani AG-1 IA]|uniref:Uncharacterized protein n=1 Tax=Thanatephorus cucumeris (strain AG1-IA) TaxID=983506 RepID=L8X8S3_THACA|nr:hypothetical protein AG1IA_00481 [Rhizoctonia solani AG-1 IA]
MERKNLAGRDEDSDDDVPLTNIKVRAPESDDDEDAPLSNLKSRQSVVLPDLKPASTLDIAASLGLAPEPTQTKAAGGDDSDDEVPLAIHRQTIMLPQDSNKKPGAENDDSDDDEKPLGLRLSQAPSVAQQRRQEEYQQMMLMQQQQQLMMQQQAMRASMFSASMLSFQPHMGGPGSVHSFGAPVPAQDPKLTRVDQWRHDVSGVNDPTKMLGLAHGSENSSNSLGSIKHWNLPRSSQPKDWSINLERNFEGEPPRRCFVGLVKRGQEHLPRTCVGIITV